MSENPLNILVMTEVFKNFLVNSLKEPNEKHWFLLSITVYSGKARTEKSNTHFVSYFFNLFELSMLASEEGSNLNSILKIQGHVELYMKDAS